MATIHKPTAQHFEPPPPQPEEPQSLKESDSGKAGKTSHASPKGPCDHPYTVHHHGKRVGQMSAVFEESHSVPRLMVEPDFSKAKGGVGEIDKEHLMGVRKAARVMPYKSYSVPRLFDSPHTSPTPKARGQVGEIDRKHLRRVKELADGMFEKSHSVPRLFDSPRTPKGRAEVGEIDTEHIKRVKELAETIALVDLKARKGKEIREKRSDQAPPGGGNAELAEV